jgi:CMP-N-acetylneuraminic acid synthetase
MKKILSFIPARGNSKGIPLKNLVELNGKSLLDYTVSASLNSKLINRTIVSTDNKKIKEESKMLGAEVVVRPKKLSGDKIGIEPAIQYTLDFLKKKENYVPDVIILLSNTHPFKTSLHIDEALSLLFKKKYFLSFVFALIFQHQSNHLEYQYCMKHLMAFCKNQFYLKFDIYF